MTLDIRVSYASCLVNHDRERAADVVYRLAPQAGRIRWIYERFQMGFDEEGTPEHIDGVAHVTLESTTNKQCSV